MPETTATDPGFFELLYGKGKEVIDAMKKPLERKRLSRKFHAAHDDSIKIIGNAKDRQQVEFEKLADCDINKLITLEDEIAKAEHVQTTVKSLYFKAFGKSMVINDNDY